jgi:hypothetical protein
MVMYLVSSKITLMSLLFLSFFQVLDITAYESRQSYYASKGQKHFYFMALNGGEVCLFDFLSLQFAHQLSFLL